MCRFGQAIRIAGMVPQMLARQVEVTDDIEPRRRGDREPEPPALSLLGSVTHWLSPDVDAVGLSWVCRGSSAWSGRPRPASLEVVTCTIRRGRRHVVEVSAVRRTEPGEAGLGRAASSRSCQSFTAACPLAGESGRQGEGPAAATAGWLLTEQVRRRCPGTRSRVPRATGPGSVRSARTSPDRWAFGRRRRLDAVQGDADVLGTDGTDAFEDGKSLP